MVYILFIAGFVILIFGATYLVDGASALGAKLKIPPIVIGFTIVALGTSLPELVISVLASVNGQTDLAISNVIGSNTLNIFIILGVSALIYPITASNDTTWKTIPFSLLSALLLGICVNDIIIDNNSHNLLSRTDGLVCLLFFLVFIYYSIDVARKNRNNNVEANVKDYSTTTSVFFIVVGIIGLYLGGNWIVDGSLKVAKLFGMSESQVGLTIVAFSTSLPELATSAVAAAKKNTDVAIGNAVGSNVFNVFLVLGLSSLFNPLPFKPSMNADLGMVILSNILLFAFIFIGKGRRISRGEGILFIIIYLLYLVFFF